MRVARWKLMGGALLLSAGGLMAVADGPNLPPITLPGCQPAPMPVLPVTYLSPPVAVPAPRVAELPPPAPALPPASPTLPATAVVAVPAVALPAVTTAAPVAPRVELPALPPPAFTTVPDAKPALLPRDVAVPQRVEVLRIFTDPLAPQPFQPVAAPAPAVPTEKPLTSGADRPERTTSATAERRLKVVLHMGDDRPRFEVRDGDEVYLKVVSDRVEVKSAADKADAATMKAGGKVGFVTPGGDGTCDELTILPGSGQVVAAGNVSFRHTWGRSETTVTAERMTFRLAHPGPTAIQAGYTPIK